MGLLDKLIENSRKNKKIDDHELIESISSSDKQIKGNIEIDDNLSAGFVDVANNNDGSISFNLDRLAPQGSGGGDIFAKSGIGYSNIDLGSESMGEVDSLWDSASRSVGIISRKIGKKYKNKVQDTSTFVRIMHICKDLSINSSLINEDNYVEIINEAIIKRNPQVYEQFKVGNIVWIPKIGQFSKILEFRWSEIILSGRQKVSTVFDKYIMTNDSNRLPHIPISEINIIDNANILLDKFSSFPLDVDGLFKNLISINQKDFGIFIFDTKKGQIPKISINNEKIIINKKEYNMNEITFGTTNRCFVIHNDSPVKKPGILQTRSTRTLFPEEAKITDYRPILSITKQVDESAVVTHYVIDRDNQIKPIESANLSDEERSFLMRMESESRIAPIQRVGFAEIQELVNSRTKTVNPATGKDRYKPYVKSYDDSIFDLKTEDGVVTPGETWYYVDMNSLKLGFEKSRVGTNRGDFKYFKDDEKAEVYLNSVKKNIELKLKHKASSKYNRFTT